MKALLFMACLALIWPALAENSKALEKLGYSAWAIEKIQKILKARGWHVEENPESKRLNQFYFLTLAVFEDQDLFPQWLNAWHHKSEPEILARAWEIQKGEIYEDARIHQAAARLVKPNLISSVWVIPIQALDPNEVNLLILVKDVWSLRLNSDYQWTGQRFDFLSLSFGEENLLGRHQRLMGYYGMTPWMQSLGLWWNNPYIWKDPWAMDALAMAYWENQKSSWNGYLFQANVGRPLTWQRTWGWELRGSYWLKTQEVIREGQVDVFEVQPNLWIPWRWRERGGIGEVGLLRAFFYGNQKSWRQESSLGLGLLWKDEFLDDNPSLEAAFQGQGMPEDRHWMYIYGQDLWKAQRWFRTQNVQTLGLEELLDLGWFSQVQWKFGSSAWDHWDFLAQSQIQVSYGWCLDRHYWNLAVHGGLQWTHAQWEQLSSGMAFYYLTPALLNFGKVHFKAVIKSLWKSEASEGLVLGGDGELRGYPTQWLVGKRLWVIHGAFRTLPVLLWAQPLGAAFFIDSGGMADQKNRGDWGLSMGFGVRILFPQFNRMVQRLDWAIPLRKEHGFGRIQLSFGQVF